MLDDVINLLLNKRANLREELEREFKERSDKIESLLEQCGYVEPAQPENEELTGNEVADTDNFCNC